MKTTHRLICWAPLLSGMLLSGCGAYLLTPGTAPTDPIPTGAAKVCIVRVGADGSTITFTVKDNGTLVGATTGGSCFCYFAAQGSHEIESRSDGYDTLEFEAKAGSEHVIIQATRAAVGIVRAKLDELSPDEGKASMKTCQYSVLTQTPEGNYKPNPSQVVAAK